MKKEVGLILAAGSSLRLKELTKDIPKSLLEVNHQSLFERHLKNLKSIGIKKIYVVVGFLKEKIIEKFSNDYHGIKIIYIESELYHSTGHSLSLLIGINHILKKENNLDSLVLVHADFYGDPKILNLLRGRAHKPGSFMMYDPHYITKTNDECIIFGKDDFIDSISFNPNFSQDKLGEYIGIAYFVISDLKVIHILLKNFIDEYGPKESYEVAFENFFNLNQLNNIYSLSIKNHNWININYLEDYENAIKLNL